MIYLIGTYHNLQHNGEPHRSKYDVLKARKDFVAYIKEESIKNNVKLLAEECNQDFLNLLVKRNYPKVDSLLKGLADQLKIEHRFCDPGFDARRDLDIPDGGTEGHPEKPKFDVIREKYWLGQIIDKKEVNIIYVCGKNHIESFNALVELNGMESTILDAFWGEYLFEE